MVGELRQRRPRHRNQPYLDWLKKQACACGCGSPAPSDGAHIRSSSIANDKDFTGGGRKPSDFWALPLNRSCHIRQHAYGDELGFWAAHGIRDVFSLALRYNALYSKETGKDPKQHIERRGRPRTKSRAAGPKRKIANRSNWPKGRRIKSRGFK